MTPLDADLAAFVTRLREKLDAGARQYGNTSFERPLVDLISEIQDELVDIAGWGLILWSRLQALRDRVAQVEQGGGTVVDHQVRVLSWVKASDADIRSGLLGFISVEFGPLVLDGIVLRRTEGGRFALSFPARTDRAGKRHSYIRPIDDAARIEIERTILGQLGQHPEVVS